MSISELQNFFKTKLKVACGAGTGNIYVDTKPTPTNGFLVISPGSESLREIIKYTGTGTDGTGDYVTVLNIGDRGLGGTTAQAHAVGEPVRMNYTAQHQKEIDDTINAIVSAGAPDSSTTVKGIVKLATAPASPTEPIAVGTNDPRLNATTGLTTDKEDALAGGGDFGTPSASNKFVTEEYQKSETTTPTIQVFTSSGTWNKPAGLKYIVVEVVGGGGGGGSSSATNGRSGGGGGGGGYSKKKILASSLGSTETVTCGSSGSAGSNGNGGTGGTSSFGSHCSATGGTGGVRAGEGGGGGSGSSGDLNLKGAPGGAGSTANAISGHGGSTLFGGGGQTVSSNSLGDAGVTGGGGSGGSVVTGAADRAGGGGGVGIVIVTEYYT